ncbi:MAG: ribosome recycling factor [Dehalococcoidales bacterium]
MDDNTSLTKTETKMKTSVEALRKELSSIRTGHATPALVEHIKVEYAGVPTSLIQIAGISTSGASTLVIQPWDKGSLRSIEKAILKSDLGLNPVNDGNIIRINIPPLSEERRQEMIKVVRARVEKERVIIRNIRRDTMEELRKLEKDKEISQDDLKRTLDQLQKLTDKYVEMAGEVGQDKETELKQV